MILLKNCHVFAPEDQGIQDIFIAGQEICAMGPDLEVPKGFRATIVDAGGAYAFPGLIDGHVHIAGGGGEGGPASRTSELQGDQLLKAGVTSVIGCLGFDGITRNVESVLMKAKALRAEGFGAWLYTGAYQVPAPTITGDVARDVALFEEIIGVGEVAIADRRSSFPNAADLVRLAKKSRTGGMLGGSCGLVHLHLGDEPDPFALIHEAVAIGRLSYHDFYPTHCSRNHALFQDAIAYAKKGPIDLTASSYPYFPDEEVKPSSAVHTLLQAGVPLGHITMSSDACGSLPRFDEHGRLVGHDIGQPDCLIREVWDMVDDAGLDLSTALTTVTANPAKLLHLHGRGQLRVGSRGDLILLSHEREMLGFISDGKTRFLHETLQSRTTGAEILKAKT